MEFKPRRLFTGSTIVVLILATLFLGIHGTAMMYPQNVQEGGASRLTCSPATVGMASNIAKDVDVMQVTIGRVVTGSNIYSEIVKLQREGNSSVEISNLPNGRYWETSVASNTELSLLMFGIKTIDRGIYDCGIRYRLKQSNHTFATSRQEILIVDTYNYDIVSDTSVTRGHLFTVTCDAQRVIRSIREHVDTIIELRIRRAAGSSYINTFETIAWYDYKESCYRDTISYGQDWEISCYGANNGVKNFETMSLQIIVNKAEDDDEGEYECRVTYRMINNDREMTDWRSQNITVNGAGTGFNLFTIPVTGQTSIPLFLFLGPLLIAIILDV